MFEHRDCATAHGQTPTSPFFSGAGPLLPAAALAPSLEATIAASLSVAQPSAAYSVESFQARLDAVKTKNRPEFYFKAAVQEALAALSEGNYGIGAVAVSNQIIVGGRNRIFHPAFDPAHHAEMDVLNNLRQQTGSETFKGVSIYTSLEPTCPHCLLALLAAGIKTVYFPVTSPASDNLMVESVISGYRTMRNRVSATSNGKFQPIAVNSDLQKLGAEIFSANRQMLDHEIIERGGLDSALTHLMVHPAGRESLSVRPNTGLPADFIQENMIVCTGEDPHELVHALQTVMPDERPAMHQYRCYYAWKFAKFTVVLSGIGTGSLEPMMFELLDKATLGEKAAKRLVMIGTAGYLSDTGFGQVYLVDGAYPVGCGVKLKDEDLPVRPEFDQLESVNLPRAEEISTDYYYACTPQVTDPRKVLAKAEDPALAEGLKKHWKSGRLISMETAQFYHLGRVYGDERTQFVAFRGVANLADQFETQGDYSQKVLSDALGHAVQLLTR
jgi:tRNA(Arg) A34 adenosine deaminase TadA